MKQFIFRIYAPNDTEGFNVFINAFDTIEAFNIIRKKYPYADNIINLTNK